MPLVIQQCACSVSTTRHIGVLDDELSCGSISLVVRAFASLVASRCCLQSKIRGVDVSPDSLLNAPLGVVGGAPRMDLSCRLKRGWRLSRLPTYFGSHKSSLLDSVTASTQVTWAALAFSGTTLDVFVRAG